MKKVLIALCASLLMLTGCDKLPDAQKLETLSTSIGFAAGMAVDLAGVSTSDRAAIIEVLDIVDDIVPERGQSFTDAWKPVIDKTVEKLIAEQKIDNRAGELIKTALSVATQGLDYMFDVRWPTAKEYKELVSAGVRGFTTGFKTVITPPNTFSAMNAEILSNEDTKAEFDRARMWFSLNLKK